MRMILTSPQILLSIAMDGNITADTLTLSLIGDFDYASDFGNIDATNQNFIPSRW